MDFNVPFVQKEVVAGSRTDFPIVLMDKATPFSTALFIFFITRYL